jgi:outer membrane immunogenic protein
MSFARAASFVAAAFLASGALAADPPRMMAPVVVAYNWTGWYMGAHAGARWVEDYDPRIVAFGAPLLLGLPSNDETSFVAGGQAGYNRQFAPNWVAGIEGDISWGRNKVSAIDPTGALFVTNVLNVPQVGFNTVTSTSVATALDARLNWNASVRGRIGYAMDRWWFFVTGGLALADAELRGVQTFSQTIQVFRTAGPDLVSTTVVAGTPVVGKKGEVLYGPTVGGGIEWAFADNWSLRGEYLYADYGRQTVVFANGASFRSDFTTHTARVALNYKFPYK